MSILDALKQVKQQTGSLDELASLPQAMIMQMAKTGQIPKESVMPILSRQAELAQKAANERAIQQPGAQPTVLEKLLASTPQPQMQPQQVADVGVAQLPIREDMYNEQRMAGGGIVAFQDNPNQPVREGMPGTYNDNPYLERSRDVYEAGQEFFNPRNYNPFAKISDIYQAYQRNIGQPFAGAVNRFINEPVGEQADRFRRASQARENIGKRASGVPTTSEEARRLAPAEKIVGSEQALYDAERLAKETKRTALPSVGPGGQVIAPAAGTKEQKVAAAGANVASQETGTSAIDEYAKILRQQGEDSTKARQEAKYMRLLEAGLGIMGGTSPYAFTNIGQGAIGAAKGYGEDIKGFRAEERERAKALGALGMEKEKLGIEKEKLAVTKQHYENLFNLGVQENQIRKILASKPPGEIALIERYASDPKFRESAKELYGAKKTSEWDQLLMSRMGTGKPIDKEAVLKDVQTFLNK